MVFNFDSNMITDCSLVKFVQIELIVRLVFAWRSASPLLPTNKRRRTAFGYALISILVHVNFDLSLLIE